MIVYLFHANYFSFHYLYNDKLQIDDMHVLVIILLLKI